MYEIFRLLLEKHGCKAADVTRATGISSVVFSEWKKGKSTPKQDKLIKIAEYFGVTLEYLMTGEDNRFSTDSAKLNARIALDFNLQEHIGKLEDLNNEDKKSVYDMIDFLYNKAQK